MSTLMKNVRAFRSILELLFRSFNRLRNSDPLNMYPVSKTYIRSTYESYLVLTNKVQRLESFEGHSAGWP